MSNQGASMTSNLIFFSLYVRLSRSRSASAKKALRQTRVRNDSSSDNTVNELEEGEYLSDDEDD
jgi:hypothetical protein